MYGGYLVAVQLLGANPVTYIDNSFQFLELDDVIVRDRQGGGLRADLLARRAACAATTPKGGAEGVGRSTTRAVVGGSLAILFADFFLTKLLF